MKKKAQPGPAKKSPPKATGKDGTGAKPEPGARDRNVPETGGRLGPDPTRYGDWEKDGRCVDF
jgi:hypothetical protein